MLINHYKTTSNGLDHLKRRNKVIILVILFALVAFVYSMIWIDYQERKKSERPSLNQIVDEGGSWTIVNDEKSDAPVGPPPAQ